MRLSHISMIVRLRGYAIACGLLVLTLLTLADQISMHFGLGEWQRFVDDICGGIVAGLLFYLYEKSRINNLNVQESVQRIDWALREILPGTLANYEDRGENRAA